MNDAPLNYTQTMYPLPTCCVRLPSQLMKSSSMGCTLHGRLEHHGEWIGQRSDSRDDHRWFQACDCHEKIQRMKDVVILLAPEVLLDRDADRQAETYEAPNKHIAGCLVSGCHPVYPPHRTQPLWWYHPTSASQSHYAQSPHTRCAQHASLKYRTTLPGWFTTCYSATRGLRIPKDGDCAQYD